MRVFQRLFAALSLSLMAATAGASPDRPANGVEYRTLDKAQSTDAGKKVEVTEFFWYSCPHCNAFDPMLSEWVKKQGGNIIFKRVPVAFRDTFAPQQRLYYTIEALGKTEELHKKIFNAIHAQNTPLATDAEIIDFMVKQGIDKQKFLELFNSFGVQTKARRATQLQGDYKVDGVPLVAIDGRYMTSPSIVGNTLGKKTSEAEQQAAALRVMDALVMKAGNEHKLHTADAKPAGVKSGAETQKK